MTTMLEQGQQILRGERTPPPIACLLGFVMKAVEPGRAVFEMQADERHYNPHYINDSDDIDRPKIAGTACRIASAASCLIRLKKNAPPPITSPSARKWTRFAKTDSKSPRPTIMRTIGWTTIARTGYAFAEAAARSRTG